MFGYVQADRDELKVREYRLYRAYYCGLCRTLQKKYGFFTKFLLNYDCTFASILLSLIMGSTELVNARCPFNPFKRETMAEVTPETEFAAALNVIFAYNNLLDKYRDDKKLYAGFAVLLFRGAYKKAKKNYPDAVLAVEDALQRLNDVEKANNPDIDDAANCSADMLSGAISAYPFGDDAVMQTAKRMCADIGRWIYIADAWTDRIRDEKTGSYNPANLSEAEKDDIMHLLYTTLSRAKDAYDRLPFDRKDPAHAIIDNMLCRGCAKVTEQVLSDKYNTKRRKNGSI